MNEQAPSLFRRATFNHSTAAIRTRPLSGNLSNNRGGDRYIFDVRSLQGGGEWTVGDFHDFVKVSVDAPPFPPSCVSIKSTQGFRLVDRSARKDREIFDSFSIEERKIEESLDSSFS